MVRKAAPTSPPVVLTVAGSDSGGGAGIQADLKTIEALGGFGTSVITSITAQNTQGVSSTHIVSEAEIKSQLTAVTSDFDVRAIKTGMLATADNIAIVNDAIGSHDTPLVVDPVMVAATGDRLLEPAAEAAYEELIGNATVVTPNADEAQALTEIDITDTAAAIAAGEELLKTGVTAALVKGGHVPGDTVTDVLVQTDETVTFEHPRVDSEATHGSGCTLSSAIAVHLANNRSVTEAVEAAIEFLERAVRYPLAVGEGPGAVHHLVSVRNDAASNTVREAIEGIIDSCVSNAVRGLVPEVGMNIVGALPYAETTAEVAAVEGRITKKINGVTANRGVRYGASSHVARFLLTCREHDPSIQFAANCRWSPVIEDAIQSLPWETAMFDRETEPAPDFEGSTMQWAADHVFQTSESTPVAITDEGGVGKEPMTRLLAPDKETLEDRITTLAAAIDD